MGKGQFKTLRCDFSRPPVTEREQGSGVKSLPRKQSHLLIQFNVWLSK